MTPFRPQTFALIVSMAAIVGVAMMLNFEQVALVLAGGLVALGKELIGGGGS